MSLERHPRYRRETAPTWIEQRPWLEKTTEVLMYLFVLTAPLGAPFCRNLGLLAPFGSEPSTAFGLVFTDLADGLYSIVSLVWVLAVAVWLGSHLLRPHAPFRFEDMPFVLMAPSFLLYMIALVQGIGG